MNIVFAAISPHPPLLLPSVGSQTDRDEVQKTIDSLESLGKKLKKINPDLIIISSPHPDWGFNVPLYFLAKDLKKTDTRPYLMTSVSPQYYFEEGKKTYKMFENSNHKIALIASGDLSHCLEENGPYGFNPQGPEFDKALIESLNKKDIDTILKLDEIFPEAGECGLRSFCFMLGFLEESKINWQPEILSYEGPFGVGYLVMEFKLN